MSIPGIGPYTAGAISSIAYNQPNGLVDGNVIRVMSRLRAMKLEQGIIISCCLLSRVYGLTFFTLSILGTPAMDRQCWSLAESIVDASRPGDLNQSLMELGATVCKPLNPSCTTCPVNDQCHARILVASTSLRADPDLPDRVTYFPRKIPKKKAKEVTLSVLILVNSENKYLFVKRDSKGLLANQWEFPTIETWREGKPGSVGDANDEEEDEENVENLSMSRQEICEQFSNYLQENMNIVLVDGASNGNDAMATSLQVQKHMSLEPLVHVFSHERHTMTLNLLQVESTGSAAAGVGAPMKEHKWMSESEIREVGITSGCKKIIDAVKKTENSNSKNSKNGKKQVQTKLNFSPKVPPVPAAEGDERGSGSVKRKRESIAVD